MDVTKIVSERIRRLKKIIIVSFDKNLLETLWKGSNNRQVDKLKNIDMQKF